MERRRCAWTANGSPLEVDYHDREWGVPVHEDRRLFEILTLEGAQAGLSWATVLEKREAYRQVFRGFDPAEVAEMDDGAVSRLLEDPGIVRHRGKIESTITNARALLQIREDLGSFDAYVWGFVDGAPIQNHWSRRADVPTATDESTALCKDLKRRGFRFVGPTTCYAFMQAVGMVNDHTVDCFRHAEVKRLGQALPGASAIDDGGWPSAAGRAPADGRRPRPDQ